MKIVFSSNISWSIYNFRTKLLKSLQEDGHQIYVIAKEDTYSQKLVDNGFQFIPININNNSKNPFKDIKLLKEYLKIYKKIKPDIILQNAIKPNIYGTIAASKLKIPTINNISGLGTLFIKESLSTKIAKFLYKYSQNKATTVFFQNKSDQSLFIKNKLIKASKTKIIPGSGVDTDKFHPKLNTHTQNNTFEFLFIARLIKDKGLNEYLEASKYLKEKYNKEITCSILGGFYHANETAFTEQELDGWIKKGIINYLGESDSVENEMAHANCIVLPSYREGLSKVLIEASSMEKLIITTNVPGCKDVVIDNFNGYLCEPKNANDLANQMEKMYLSSSNKRIEFGKNARKRALEVFDENIIIAIYKKEINLILKNKNVK